MDIKKIQGKITNKNIIKGKINSLKQIKGKICSDVQYIKSTTSTSDATAIESDLLTGKTAYGTNGKFTGTMPINEDVNQKLFVNNISYKIPKGYHSGNGSVNVSLEEKSITPSKIQQTITPSNEKLISKIIVNSIPDNYIDTSDADAVASNIQKDKTAYVNGIKIVGTHVEQTGLNTSDATAIASDILLNKTSYVNGKKITGTMPDNGTVNKTLDTTNISYSIPKGYHSGTGKIQLIKESVSITPTKASQSISPTTGKVIGDITVDPIPSNYIDTSDATAIASNIAKGKTAYVNGNKITGTHSCDVYTPNMQSKTITPTKSSQSVVPDSGYDGLSKVTVNAIPSNYISTTDANATASDIIKGKTAYVNGNKITGTHSCDVYTPNMQSKTITPTKSSQSVVPDSGYDGLSKVTVNSIPSNYIDTSDANAVASNIQVGKTAYVNGVKITGTHTEQSGLDTSDATATSAHILVGDTAYVNGVKITGTMSDNGAVTKTLDCSGETRENYVNIPEGYHNGSGRIKIVKSTKSVTPTKQTQSIEPGTGYVLSQVAVEPIPDNYIDTSDADATASNIAKGKTAYVNGSKITGTHECPSSGSSNNNCEAYEIDVTNPTVTFKTTTGTIKAYGYAKGSTSGYTTPRYSFTGTSYVTMSSWGSSDTTTNMTLSVSNGQLTGLPSGLTSGTIIVTRGI